MKKILILLWLFLMVTQVDAQFFITRNDMNPNDECMKPLTQKTIITVQYKDYAPKKFHVMLYTKNGTDTIYSATRGNLLYFLVGEIDYRHYSPKRFQLENDDNTYFKGYILCETNEYKDSIEYLFNLAPSRPVIKDVSFTYDSFVYEDYDFINPKATFSFTSRNADVIRITASPADPVDDGDYGFSGTTFTCSYPLAPENEDVISTIEYFGWGWRQFFRLYASNRYGESFYSDTLYTCDYIDEEINSFLSAKNIDKENTIT